MSQAEKPERFTRKVTVEDIRELTGASTPHFAQQVRGRIARLIDGLEPNDPARLLGEIEIARLTELGYTGEHRGQPAEPGMPVLPSASGKPPA